MILTDLVMPNMSGLEFLEKVKKLLPRTEVAVMTGHGSVETAVQAMKLRALRLHQQAFRSAGRVAAFSAAHGGENHAGGRNQFLRERVDTELVCTELWVPRPRFRMFCV